MRKYIVSIFLVSVILGSISFYVLKGDEVFQAVEKNVASITTPKKLLTSKKQVATEIKHTPIRYEIPSSGYVAQTFNNCGPASLSMIMSYFGVNVTQDELREEMRPYNNPTGGVDDKSIFANEYVTYAEKHGLQSLARPNGDIELLKTFVANDIPVVVRTWLHPGEDIGHFRIVRGYDDEQGVIIQDDSYEGKGLRYNYNTFLDIWKPFNYGYILVYPKEKQALVESILKDQLDEKTAYEDAVKRAEENLKNDPQSAYDLFNLSTSYYHLGDYEKSVQSYEEAQPGLPPRMLWYQIEPLQSYLETGNAERIFALTDWIFVNQNIAFSELYYLRGEAYLLQHNKDAAREEFEKAAYYNKNYTPAKEALSYL